MSKKGALRQFLIPHDAPYLPPKILYNLCFSFLLSITAVPREIENNAYAEFWGANKVHYGKHGSGVQNRTWLELTGRANCLRPRLANSGALGQTHGSSNT